MLLPGSGVCVRLFLEKIGTNQRLQSRQSERNTAQHSWFALSIFLSITILHCIRTTFQNINKIIKNHDMHLHPNSSTKINSEIFRCIFESKHTTNNTINKFQSKMQSSAIGRLCWPPNSEFVSSQIHLCITINRGKLRCQCQMSLFHLVVHQQKQQKKNFGSIEWRENETDGPDACTQSSCYRHEGKLTTKSSNVHRTMHLIRIKSTKNYTFSFWRVERPTELPLPLLLLLLLLLLRVWSAPFDRECNRLYDFF